MRKDRRGKRRRKNCPGKVESAAVYPVRICTAVEVLRKRTASRKSATVDVDAVDADADADQSE